MPVLGGGTGLPFASNCTPAVVVLSEALWDTSFTPVSVLCLFLSLNI